MPTDGTPLPVDHEPPKSATVAISVIVPARNAAKTLESCLDALSSEGVPGRATELIVVDDRSTDETARIATRPNIRLLTGEGRGPAAARNLGARHARGSILVYLDADTAPRPGWLSEMIRPLDDPQVVAVKGRYETAQRSIVARFAQIEFEEKYDRLAKSTEVDFVDTGTAAYRRTAFDAAHGFDESFPPSSAEDIDLSFRLAEHGDKLVFNPRAIVFHRHAESLIDYLRKKARYGYFRVRVYRRFPKKALGDSYTPRTMPVQIALSGLSSLLMLRDLARMRFPDRLGLIVWGVLIATTAPLMLRALNRDRVLVPLIAPFVFLRSIAQGFGIFVGLVSHLADRVWATDESARSGMSSGAVAVSNDEMEIR